MKTILVALDGSARAPEVLAEARLFAEQFNAKLVLYRAVGLPADVPSSFWKTSNLDLPTILLQHAEHQLRELAATVPADLLASTHVDIATAWDGICRYAEAVDAQLIVIGSHGNGAIDRILGTTAARTVDNAARNVLVIRPKASGIVTS
jgi:nucleotide-binding universal stress UspA family protein